MGGKVYFSILAVLTLLTAGCATDKSNTPPRSVNAPILDYPPEAILQRESGVLVVLLQISEDGSMNALHVKRSTGFPVLDEAGLEFVRRLEFLPAVSQGRKQACWAEQRVIFSMEKDPLDLHKWRKTTHRLLQDLQQAGPEEAEALQQQLYNQCAEYMRNSISRPDPLLNRMAINLVGTTVRDQWEPYTEAFPMSFLMYADFVERFQNAHLARQALRQLQQSVIVDIQRIDQSLTAREDPTLRQLRNSMIAYLGDLQ